MPSVRHITWPTLKSVSQLRTRLILQLKRGGIASKIDHTLASRIDPSDTLVVSGFWRSGTTWLQERLAELLRAKTVFEPFHFMVPATDEIFACYQISNRSESFRELFIPFCGDSTFNGHVLHGYYDRALRADLPGGAVRVLRKGVSEGFRPRIVLKLTRGQLSLRAAQNTFSMPVIHVYRDPRAIVASAKMTDWYWLFDHLRLQEALLELQDGRASFFGCWSDEIREYDKDKVSRIAAYWALTEKFLQHSYADGQARIVFVSYEELCRGQESLMLEILKRLNVRTAWEGKSQTTNGDSYSTSNQRRGASVDERISGWRRMLSSSEIDTIESIAKHFGFHDRLVPL